MSSRPTTRPARSTVLPGREAPILPDPGEHVVLHAPLNGPWPRGAEVLHLAGGCFWGVERILWRRPGVVVTAVGYMGGTTPNPTYREAADFGREIAEHADALTGLTKRNRIAIMISNEALTALEWFGLESGFPRRYSGGGANYNDVFRWVYDALFDLNLEADVIPADADAEH